MLPLFPDQSSLPIGFKYIPDFLSLDEETALYKEIEKIPLHTFLFQGFEAKRKVASFGYDYSFDKRKLSKGTSIPPVFDHLIARVASLLSIDAHAIAELLITAYPVGAVINWHRDAPPFDVIVGISLLSDCIFKFRPHVKAEQTRQSIISYPVARRSLYIIRDAARTDWQHSIAPVKHTRYSITLRTLRE